MSQESLLTILLSGVFAALVSGILSIWLQKLQFKNEYYKLIISKRLEAYYNLDKVISYGFKSTKFSSEEKYYEFLCHDDTIREFRLELSLLYTSSRMYTGKTWGLMIKISECVSKFESESFLFLGEHAYEDHVNLAIQYHYILEPLFMELQNSINKDFLNLHDLKNIAKHKQSLAI